ncbi:MAG: cytochrome C, partial [Opitutae bacterium]|nr:cytochrome C [Opitutae bacterium]
MKFYKFLLCLLFSVKAFAAPGDDVYQRGFLSVEDSHKSIELPDGYSLELVLSEPQVEEPVAMAWDGNGVLYVVEMRTYMQTADATGEQEPLSRISRHEDTNGDGIYDKSTVFIDKLLLPRMVLPLDDRVMVGITNTLDLWNYSDSDGDGVADQKTKVFEGGRRGGNMEHQPSGLIWGLDNWIYITYQNVRYRYTNGVFKTERLP